MEATLSIENVSFGFRRRQVLHSVTLNISIGATLLLGPNGAGKSTLLEVMASVRRPATGTVAISGVGGTGPGIKQLARYRHALAWLPQTVTPYPGVTVREHVALAGWLKGMSKAEAWSASTRALEQASLSGQAAERVTALSGGQTRRLGLAGALVHDASVLLLDEPTANLDPAQRRQFRDVLDSLSHDRTILVSSHDTEAAAAAFQNVVVLASGSIRFAGSMADFVEGVGSNANPAERMQLAYEKWVGDVE